MVPRICCMAINDALSSFTFDSDQMMLQGIIHLGHHHENGVQMYLKERYPFLFLVLLLQMLITKSNF